MELQRAYDYPEIGITAWSERIRSWNAMHRDRRREMLAATSECREQGHDYRRSPVGVFCPRCCQYFRDEGD